jgi:hypothetical protein
MSKKKFRESFLSYRADKAFQGICFVVLAGIFPDGYWRASYEEIPMQIAG